MGTAGVMSGRLLLWVAAHRFTRAGMGMGMGENNRYMWSSGKVVWLLTVILGGGYASAQTEVRNQELWSFEGSTGDVVSVEVVSADFDPTVELLAPTGDSIGFNDDGGSGLNAALVAVLPVTGGYLVRAGSFDEDARGSYEVVMRLIDVRPLTADMTSNGMLSGRVSEAGGFWSFDGTAGQVFSVEASSEEFDTLVALLSPTGEGLGSNDDAGDLGTDSRLVAVVPEAGRYLIRVTSYRDGGSGEYSLSFRVVENPPMLAQGVAGGTASERGDFLSFEGVAGQIVRVQASSDNFDPVIEVVSPGGDRLGIDDDGGGGLDAALVTVLPTTGRYRARVTASSEERARGTYEVAVQPMDVQPLVANASGIAMLGEGGLEAQILWSFEGMAGQTVAVNASSDDFDTVVKLLVARTGEVVAVNDDGDIDTNSELTAILHETGRYLVQVTSFDGVGGAYEVRVDTVDAGELVPGVAARGSLN